MTKNQIITRLEYLRGQIRAEKISYAEIEELKSLAKHIDAFDVELLQWADVPEKTQTMTKAQMIKFITGFEKYPTMNSWNHSNGYSYNVKIHNLPLTKDEREAAYTMLNTDEFYENINEVVDEWGNEMKKYGTHSNPVDKRDVKEEEPNFTAGFNGRSSGHLVLYRWNGHNYAGSGWSYDEDEFKEMSIDEVKYIYDILKEFEALYNQLIGCVKSLVRDYKVEDETYTIEKTRKVLVDR
jgi:hypothetical protein